tara:strand:+ start:957 stop:3740 length:2784 start_codon:yes stop_codon:yes gene_type:complete
MPDQLQLRGGTTTEHNSFTGVSKEVTVDTTKKTLVVHDGSTAGGTPLMREGGSNGQSTVGIGTAGSNAIEISSGQDIKFVGADSTKHLLFDKSVGNLGVGTTSPAERLHLATSGGADTIIRLDTNQNATRVRAKVVGGENHLVLSSNNNSEDVVITGSRVGIKENSPDSILHIKDGNPDLILENTGGGTGQLRVGHFTNGAFIGTYSDDGGGSDVLRIGTHSGDERLRVTSDGNIGIGFQSPTITDARVRIKGKNNSTTQYSDGVMVTSLNESVFKRYSWAGIETQGGMQFSELTSGLGETMRITTNGLVGIGTTSPAGSLHVDANSGVDGAIFDSGGTANTSHALLVRDSGNNQLLRVNNNANTGIGTNNPLSRLQVTRADSTAYDPADDAAQRAIGSTIMVENGNGTTNSFAQIAFDLADSNQSIARIVAINSGTSSSDLAFVTENNNTKAEKLRITKNGNIGIGTADPAAQLDAANNLVIGSTSDADSGMTFVSSTSGQSLIHFSDATSGNARYDGFIGYEQNNRALKFGTAQAEKMRLNSDGDLIIGASTTPQGRIEVVKASGGSNFDALNLRNHAGDANSAVTLNFIKSTDATNTAARSYIRSTRSGSNSFLDFATSNTAAMRITTDGKVGIGANLTAIDAPLSVSRDVAQTASLNKVNQTAILKNSGTSSTDSRTSLYFASQNSSNQLSPSAIACTAGTNYQSALRFYVNGNGNGTGHLESYERMTINHDGDVLIGTNSTSNAAAGFKVTSAGKILSILRGDNSTHLFLNKLAGNDGTVATFAIATATKGTISVSSTATAYNTSSDYRLKENVVSISDGITRLKALKPSRFNFKTDASTTVDGFLAHEVTSTVPEAITGAKDAVVTQAMVDNEEYEKEKLGEIIPQQIDQSKLVPLLTAALQEAISKIETLEAKVAALEAA